MVGHILSQALDVSKINAWVTYSEPLQRFHEFGTNSVCLHVACGEVIFAWNGYLDD